MNGVLIIDKPAGITSHDVVNRVRRILNQRSVGHLGTLDPMATGVLPLVVGNFTRLAQFYLNSEKSYEGIIHFGISTDTYDAEGDPTGESKEVSLAKEELASVAARFRGVIEQVPPPFSAKKIKGVPAYKLARRQKEVVLPPVQVEVKEFEILNMTKDRAQFRARVSSGTYMRSVAHDMGKMLGCGAHLESLRRTGVAEFTLADAHSLEQMATAAGNSNVDRTRPGRDIPEYLLNTDEGSCEGVDGLFVHPRKLLPQLPAVTADDLTAARIRAGRTVNLPDISRARQIKVFAGQTELVAIATRVAGTLFHAKIVLNASDTPVHQR
jgi:tRNA pseudouridine55 synthase